MNMGFNGEGFPYTNFHDMNLDWMIKIAKDFLDQYTHIQEVIAQGLEDLQDKTDTGLDSLQEKYEALDALLQAWYDEHSEDIAGQLADALQDLNDWYTLHSGYLDQALEDNLTAFNNRANQKANEVIESIPDDYTALATSEYDLRQQLFKTGVVNALTPISFHQPTLPASGVQITYLDKGKYSMVGTATAAIALDFWNDYDSLPESIKPGKKYRLTLTGLHRVFYFRIYFSTNGTSWDEQTYEFRDETNTTITIPADAIGILMRVYIANGTTVDTVFSAEINTLDALPNVIADPSNIAYNTREFMSTGAGYLTPISVSNGFYRYDLTFIEADNYITEKYDVIPSEYIHVINKVNGGSLQVGYVAWCIFYNDDESRWYSYITNLGDNNIDRIITIPFWATKMVITRDASFSSFDYYVGRERGSAIFIGDSYTQANSLTNNDLNIHKRFATLISRKFGWKELNFAVGGMGFLYGNTTFITQLNNAISDNSYEHDKVKYIFVVGGRNDVSSLVDWDDLPAAVSQVISTAKANFPNAKVVLIPMMWDVGSIHQNIYYVYKLICNAAIGTDAFVIPHAYSWLHGMKDMILPDNVHPNEDGHARLANCIGNSLISGYYDVLPNTQPFEIYSSKLDNSSFFDMVLESGMIEINANMVVNEQINTGTKLFEKKSTTTKNNLFYLSSYPTRIPVFNVETGETGIVLAYTTYTETGYENYIQASTVLTPGSWYVLNHQIKFALERFAGSL